MPPLPAEITPEKIARWEEMGLELHYLPPVTMGEFVRGRIRKIRDVTLKNFPGWRTKPDYHKYCDVKKLAPDSLELRGGWILVDGRQKPPYDNGNQMYENDFLASAIEALRQKGVMQSFKHPRSRFNVSPQELEKPETISAFAEAIGVRPEEVTIQRQMEFSVIGNMHHPEWGATNCSEWFGDSYDSGRRRLGGGSSGYGGLSDVDWRSPAYRDGSVGFRLLVRFSP